MPLVTVKILVGFVVGILIGMSGVGGGRSRGFRRAL
jgi:hypothetical protein